MASMMIMMITIILILRVICDADNYKKDNNDDDDYYKTDENYDKIHCNDLIMRWYMMIVDNLLLVKNDTSYDLKQAEKGAL